MAQSVPPGDIATQPGTKIVFNALYDHTHTYHIKVTNSSARRIAWKAKITSLKRLDVNRATGVLDPKENALIAYCDPFVYGQEDTNNDRVTIEWTNTPDKTKYDGFIVAMVTRDDDDEDPDGSGYREISRVPNPLYNEKQFRHEWFEGDVMVSRKNLPIEYNP